MSWQAEMGRLYDAIEHAEGGREALVRAVRCSLPLVASYDEARIILATTVRHALWDWATRDMDGFITFLGARWAPVGAANDPTHLNEHWVPNVLARYRHG